MKTLSRLVLILIPFLASAGCAPVRPTIQLPVINVTKPATPTEIVNLPSDTPSPTITLTPFVTLESIQVTETLQPLIKNPMNCVVPCFWGIIPGKTQLDEVRSFFNRLGFTPFEGKDFYTITYNKSDSGDSSVTFYTFKNFVENIVIRPDIPQPKVGSPRVWIVYSPEALIQRYGKPSGVDFAIDWGPSTTINMIMYFNTSNFDKPDLIVNYAGSNLTPQRLCPLTAPFDFVRLWMGYNPPNTPSFATVPLEKATSLTMDQFTQLMLGDPKKACFSLKGEVFP